MWRVTQKTDNLVKSKDGSCPISSASATTRVRVVTEELSAPGTVMHRWGRGCSEHDEKIAFKSVFLLRCSVSLPVGKLPLL